jgi:hypothetical protein
MTISTMCQPANKRLERTVKRRRAGQLVTRPLNCNVGRHNASDELCS